MYAQPYPRTVAVAGLDEARRVGVHCAMHGGVQQLIQCCPADRRGGFPLQLYQLGLIAMSQGAHQMERELSNPCKAMQKTCACYATM